MSLYGIRDLDNNPRECSLENEGIKGKGEKEKEERGEKGNGEKERREKRKFK